MIMKSHLLLFASALLFVGGVASCSDSELASIDQTTTQADADNTPIGFSTYVGQAKDTRAGYEGAIDNVATLQGESAGFGLFAHTVSPSAAGADGMLYGSSLKYSDQQKVAATGACNFLENAKVTYNDNAWTIEYTSNSSAKATDKIYWPNPSVTHDGTVKPAYVSFFAYAPYVSTSLSSETYGITGIYHVGNISSLPSNVQSAITGEAYRPADPIIKYSTKTKLNYNKDNQLLQTKLVDLLWGTAGTDGSTYDGTAQSGAIAGKEDGSDGKNKNDAAGLEGAGAVNLNLQKMKIGGTVGFNFKHALAKIGGEGGITADVLNDVTSTTDDDNTNLASSTTVKLNWIAIEMTNGYKVYTADKYDMPTEGYFNLVTGKWAADTKKVGTETGNVASAVPFVYTVGIPSLADNNGNINFTSYIQYRYGVESESDLSEDQKAEIKAMQERGIFSEGINNASLTSSPQEVMKSYTVKRNVYDKDGENVKEPAVDPVTGDTYESNKTEDVTFSPLPLYVIPDPETVKPKLKVIVNYTLQTAEHSGVRTTQAADVDMPTLAINTWYKLAIHIGVSSMKVDAKVVDGWDSASAAQDVYEKPENNNANNGE